MAYHIIGADGKEYGPITEEMLKAWIAEGRANAQTRVRREGSTIWRMLGELPEFGLGPAPAPEGTPPPPTPYQQPVPVNNQSAADQVNGPAIGLIVMGALNVASAILTLLAQVAGFSLSAMNPSARIPWMNFSAGLGLFNLVITVAAGALLIYAGLNMKRLENHALAVVASVLAIIPCTSACCIIGLPLGIWALVVLYRPEVKNAFH